MNKKIPSPSFGPGGNCDAFYAAGNKATFEAPAFVASMGLDAYEYQGGSGLRASDAAYIKIKEYAEKYNIKMSLHAPYYISLSGTEPEKRLKSIDYIRQSLNAAALLGADIIVVHTGSAAKITRSEAMSLAADTLEKTLDALGDVEAYKTIKIGLETMGKQNQLGTLDEVLTLCKISPRLAPVVDFGHLNARECGGVFNDESGYLRVFDSITNALGAEAAERLHCHFSKIEYTKMGEKKHLTFEDREFGPEFSPLAKVIAENGLSPRIICESDGTMTADARAMKDEFTAAYKKQ